MKPTNLLMIATAVVCTAGGLLLSHVQAAPVDRPGAGLGGTLRERIVERLGLTLEQQETVRAVILSEKETIVFLAKSLHQAREDLRSVMQRQDATESMVRAAAAKVAEVRAEIAVTRFKIYQRIRPTLTPEQLDKVQAFEAKASGLAETLIERLGERLGQ